MPTDRISSEAAGSRFLAWPAVNPAWVLGCREVWGFQGRGRIAGKRKTLAGSSMGIGCFSARNELVLSFKIYKYVVIPRILAWPVFQLFSCVFNPFHYHR